jgi:type II restriction enzyme
MAPGPDPIRILLARWREDVGATYRTWFLWDERLKNFRSIRRGLQTVIDEIAEGRFGTAYRGSSLEVVVSSIAEQRQMFRGADHAFLWKPKLRIPDIYENADHQRAFGRFLDVCCGCSCANDVVAAIRELDRRAIKGLGPAVANLLYFLHPTLVPPFNTAIVKGYNALTGANVRLGRWGEYLAMRDGILRLNEQHRELLSNDLGAVAGLLFDVGRGRYHAPPREDDEDLRAHWEADLARVRDEAAAERKLRDAERATDLTHTQVQGWLRDLGVALGFSVWIASNDRSRPYAEGVLSDRCLDELPAWIAGHPGADAVRLIDVLWIDASTGDVAAAFEVEHTTSIYSGIVRLLDLALGAPERTTRGLFLVAPGDREREVEAQLRRPAFERVRDLDVRYLPYGELERHREAMARFGRGLHPILEASRPLR